MGPDLERAFNAQITKEFASSYQYLAFAAWLEAEGLPGMAQWMQHQAEEERDHGMRFYQFVLDRNGRVELGAIDMPKRVFEGPLDVFEHALAAERSVTSSINELYAMAVDTRDFASIPILDWFVNEQVEEEATVQQIIDDLTRADGEGHAVLMLDRELGTRGPEDED